MKVWLAAQVAMFLQYATYSQILPPASRFEVASVKPAPKTSIAPTTGARKRAMKSRESIDAGRIAYSNTTLARVITVAYGVERNQVTGPAWLDSEEYDIIATFAPGTSKEQLAAMLQNLLAERFKMKMHWDTKRQRAYALLVGKNGLHLKHSNEKEGEGHVFFGDQGRAEFISYTIPEFAHFLTNVLDRPVIDMTGVQGRFDIITVVDIAKLKSQAGAVDSPGEGDGSALASVFSSMKELGLKLESRAEEVKHLIIDTAEKVPTEN